MDERKGHPPRLCSWDYSRPAPYFVTFKVAARERLLGERSRDRLVLSSAGRIVEDCWRGLPDRFPVRLDVHVIMPDHVHAIVHLLDAQDATRQKTSAMPMMARTDILLGEVVRSWKARSTFEIRRSENLFRGLDSSRPAGPSTNGWPLHRSQPVSG